MGERWSWIFGVRVLNYGKGSLGMESNENQEKETIAEIEEHRRLQEPGPK
jgi:hypothetical protein